MQGHTWVPGPASHREPTRKESCIAKYDGFKNRQYRLCFYAFSPPWINFPLPCSCCQHNSESRCLLLTALKRRLHYGWVIFLLTFSNLTVEGGSKNVQSVFLVALRDHFRSSVALTAAIFSASGLFGAFVAPLLGIVLDRYGPRVLFPIAGCFILVGWLASSMVSEVWQLFIFYSVIATVGQVGISSFSATATLAPWFPRSRGVALGMADAGNPAGQAIVVPLAQLIVSTLGWQWAFRIFGVVFFILVAVPNLLFQKRAPENWDSRVVAGPESAEEKICPLWRPLRPWRLKGRCNPPLARYSANRRYGYC